MGAAREPVRPLDVLVLHGVGEWARERPTTVRHVRAFECYTTGHRFVYQRVTDPVTEHLRSIPFDLVILDATFLGWRWVRPRAAFEALRDDYAWLRDSGAFLLAMPQDDYDHSALLDEWLSDLQVDLLVSVYLDHWRALYPRLLARGTPVLSGLTGYIDDDDIARYRSMRLLFHERSIDIGYRVRRLPANFGRFGLLKSDLGRRFAAAAQARYSTDISDSPTDTLVGDDWLHFLGSTRHALASEGGSSVLDPTGLVRDRVDAYVGEHPQASADEILAACVLPEDEALTFGTISPRVFEAALAGCCLVMIRGRFNDLIEPETHYIPVAPDLSDVDAVLDRLADVDASSRMAMRAEDALLSTPRIRYATFIADLERRVLESRESLPAGVRMGDREFFGRARDHVSAAAAIQAEASQVRVAAADAEIRRLQAAITELQRQLDRPAVDPRRVQGAISGAVSRMRKVLRRA
jgi:hypothetical protein